MHEYVALIGEKEYPVASQQLSELNLVPIGDGVYHLLSGTDAYTCRLVRIDPVEKKLTVAVNDYIFKVSLQDRYDQLVRQLGFSTTEAALSNNVFAPMPGLIHQVLVSAGDAVEAGTPLLILEAMKMENVIKAEGNGTIKAVSVQRGEAVDKRQLLIEME